MGEGRRGWGVLCLACEGMGFAGLMKVVRRTVAAVSGGIGLVDRAKYFAITFTYREMRHV